MPSFSCTVEDALDPGLRLDRYVSERLKILSRSQIKARSLEARLNGRAVKISHVLKGGEQLELSWLESESLFLIPQNLPLDVIYEDDRVIVVNKAQGMVVHPGAGNRQGTLANALLYRKLRSINGNLHDSSPDEYSSGGLAGLRPGIVHRLDKDTSGVIIAAWDDEALAFLSGQFKKRKVRKTYAALVQGCPGDKEGCIEKRIVRSRRDRKTFTVSDVEGRESFTHFKVVRSYGKYSLLLLRPKTGRTHQIRVHLKYLGNPVLGDPIYGQHDSMFPRSTLMLHAKRLSLVLPPCGLTPPGKETFRVTFRTPLPERFLEIIRAL
jgi:23S rRNA pseudouridine1911/1915/1917 synthase